MADIKIARIDFRLVHGQVIVKWIKLYPVKMIVVVDDILAEDEFLQDIYSMAIPKGVKFKAVKVEDAKEFLQKTDKSIFLIFRDPESCRKTIETGVKFNLLVVGGVPKENDRKLISDGVALNEQDYMNLKEVEKVVPKIIIRSIPEDNLVDFKDVKL